MSLLLAIFFFAGNVFASQYEFNVDANARLTIENLWAEVIVVPGKENCFAIDMSGSKESIKNIDISQTSSRSIRISERNSMKSNNTVIVSGRGSSIVVSGGEGVVIVNGKVISAGNGTVTNGNDIPKIRVAVPPATFLESYDVEKIDIMGINGKIVANVSGQESFSA